MAELLLELLSEEIPARMQARAAEDLKRLVCEGLDEKGLGKYFSEARSFVTPRRLVLVIDNLPERQMARTEVRKGPRSDAPEQAIKGFKGSLPKGAKVKVRETTKGTFLFASIHKSAQPTPELLPGVVAAALAKLPWPKSMRWADYKVRWVRPLHQILCLFDGKVVTDGWEGAPPFEIGQSIIGGADVIGGLPPLDKFIAKENVTAGHPFLAPKPFKVKNFADYKAKLKKAKVVLDPEERRKVIWKEAQKLARAEGLIVKQDDALLDEVAGMVEWPVVLMGRIDETFMDLWGDVIRTVMRHNQKYFSLLKKDGSLAPRFIVVADTAPDDGGKQIVAGNERVLRARLADARFFWDQDRKRTLESRLSALEDIIFHEKLGKMAGKVERMQALAAEIGARISGCDPERARRAARLCKADLTTQMVAEFPELQGIMGRYYALEDGESPEVADAVAEHYSPLGPNDKCPRAPVSVAVALADKIDTLVGFFAVGEKPTGSKDPFALRRAALGVIRLVIENKLRVPLTTMFRSAFMPHGIRLISNEQQYVNKIVEYHLSKDQRADENLETNWEHGLAAETLNLEAGRVASELLDFFADRMKVALKESGVRHDLISAVFSQKQTDLASEMGMPGEVDLVRVLARVDALSEFLDTDDGANLLVAYRRAANIVRIEEKNDNKTYVGVPDVEKLEAPEEKVLNKVLEAVTERTDKALTEEDFEGAMSVLSQLRQPVDAFFDNVTVNCDDASLRENRLRLLSQIQCTMDQVADFSQIEGGER